MYQIYYDALFDKYRLIKDGVYVRDIPHWIGAIIAWFHL